MNDHEHKYYLSGKTYTEFTFYTDIEVQDEDVYTGTILPVYTRTEYAVLSCNCGDVIRKVVKDD